MTVSEVCRAFGVCAATVNKIRSEVAERGIEGTVQRKKRETPPVPAKVIGDVEARIIAVACQDPPEGYSRWSIRLLQEHVVELGILDEVSSTTIYRTLKKRI